MAYYSIDRGEGTAAAIYVDPTGVAATDTATIQAALDNAKANKVPIYLGAGTWTITTQLTYHWDADIHGPIIIGTGPRSTIIKSELSSGSLLDIQATTAFKYCYGLRIEGVGFYGPTSASDNFQDGVYIKGCYQPEFINCRFYDWPNRGLVIVNTSGDATQTVDPRVVNCEFSQCVLWGYDTGRAGCLNPTVDNCIFDLCGGGVRAKPFGGKIINSTFSYCQKYPAIKIDYRGGATSRTMYVDQCWFEGNVAGDVKCYGFGHKFSRNSHNDAINTGGVAEIDCYGYEIGDLFNNSLTGTGDSVAVTAGVVTLTDSAAVFPAGCRGSTLTLSGCSNSANNGDWIIHERTSSSVVKFYNPDAVNETSAFTWAFSASCTDVTCEQDNWIITGGGGASRCTYWDAYRFGNQTQGVHVLRPNYQVFSSADVNLVKYDIASNSTHYHITNDDGNLASQGMEYYDNGNFGAASTFTPSLLNGAYHKATINADDALMTVAVPAELPNDGAELWMRISANAGASTTVRIAFNAGYVVNTGSVSVLPQGASMWIRFIYEATSNLWIQDGPSVASNNSSSPDCLLGVDPGDVNGGDTYTPNFAKTDFVRLEMASAGTLTIAAPLHNPAYTGKRVVFHIVNNAGAGNAITVSWNAAYSINTSSWQDPPNGGYAIVTLIWDNIAGSFKPLGPPHYSWSAAYILSHCIISKDSNDNISASLGTTPTQITGTFSTTNKTSDWTVTAAGGKMQYTGLVTKKFLLTGRIYISSTNLRTVDLTVSKDATNSEALSKSGCTLQAGSQVSLPISYFATMATNDYVVILAALTSSTSSVNTIQCQLRVVELPGY